MIVAESYYEIARACRAFGHISEFEGNLRKASSVTHIFRPLSTSLIALLK